VISDSSKQTIDALSLEELLHESVRGNRSRFQGDNYDYLLTQLAIVKQRAAEEFQARQLGLAQEANEIAKSANATSSKAYRMAAFSVLVAVVALLATVLQQFTHAP
jgi:hypothetical protein